MSALLPQGGSEAFAITAPPKIYRRSVSTALQGEVREGGITYNFLERRGSGGWFANSVMSQANKSNS